MNSFIMAVYISLLLTLQPQNPRMVSRTILNQLVCKLHLLRDGTGLGYLIVTI